jgi:phage/plasmid primase-like uncharacterized protein
VPSSKVGSCERASAAADRDSGVDAAAGLTACAAGAVAAGLAEALAPVVVSALWPKAAPVASIVAMAMIVVVRISDASAMRRSGADIELKSGLNRADQPGKT